MVPVDKGDKYRGDDTPTFHFVHGDGKVTHQDALACFTNMGLVVAAPYGDGDMARVVACELLEILGADGSQI